MLALVADWQAAATCALVDMLCLQICCAGAGNSDSIEALAVRLWLVTWGWLTGCE